MVSIWRGVAWILLWSVVPAALAAGQNDYDDCAQNADQDRRIAGCTSIIDDIGESNHNRQIAYDNRGTAWHAKGDNEHAIADYSDAIKLDPKDAAAFDNRGTAWRDKGDLDRAIADYDVAIRLDPGESVAYSNRGNAWNEKGDKQRAVKDYSQSIRLKPENTFAYRERGYAYFEMGNFSGAADDLVRVNDDPHAMLWRFIALGRLGRDGAPELRAKSVWLRPEAWPYPVIALYLGHYSLEVITTAAKTPVQLCEAEFYGAEWHLLHGNKSEAGAALQKAADDCPRNSKEYSAAVVERKRLKP